MMGETQLTLPKALLACCIHQVVLKQCPSYQFSQCYLFLIQDFRSTTFIFQTGAITVLWRALAAQKKLCQTPLAPSGNVFNGNSVLYWFQSLVP